MTKGSLAPPIAKSILKLARQIDAASMPDYVSVEPDQECMPGGCFQNVPAIVRRHGGSIQYGWKMRVQASAYVEGEFYAVWRRPDGALIDVTPGKERLSEILFLPDSRMTWEGEVVEPRRMMLHEQPCYCGSGIPYRICHGLAED